MRLSGDSADCLDREAVGPENVSSRSGAFTNDEAGAERDHVIPVIELVQVALQAPVERRWVAKINRGRFAKGDLRVAEDEKLIVRGERAICRVQAGHVEVDIQRADETGRIILRPTREGAQRDSEFLGQD